MTNQHSRHTYLKIKLLSLAAKARLIRREEQRWPGEHPIRYGLHEHRILDVRREARSALLAYGFLRDRAYRTIEPKCHRAPDRDQGPTSARSACPVDRLGERPWRGQRGWICT